MKFFYWRRRKDTDLDEEIQSYLELSADERMARGETEEQARLNARRAFGNVGLVKEDTRAMWGWIALERLTQDLRFGLRMLRRQPVFTLVAVLTLALGIGANTAIFSVVNAVLLRPLPYSAPDRLVTAGSYRRVTDPSQVLSPTFLNWRAQSQVFEQLAAHTYGTADLLGSGEPERLTAGMVTADLFSTLGVAPVLGRVFTDAEDQPGGPPAVILSHAFWQRRCGGDPQMVGQTLRLDGQSRTVVGIMPPGFQFPAELDLWLPLALALNQERMAIVSVIGRLKPGVTPEVARTELRTILQRTSPPSAKNNAEVQVRVVRLDEHLVGNVRQALLVLFGAVAFVLLIACANVANLLLARAAARQREMAIRAAVGAGRLRLVQQLLTESLLLSLAGGGAGLLLALWGVKLLVRMNPGGIARLEQSRVDGRVLGFTCAVALLAGLLAAVFPALQASRTNVNATIKAPAASPAARRSAQRSLPALLIAEFALTLVLLAGAGLMIKSFLRLQAVPKGFNPDGVLTLVLSPSAAKYPFGSPQRRAYFQEIQVRAGALPGIQSAGLTSFLPFAGRTLRQMGLQIEGRPPVTGGEPPVFEITLSSSDYFETMGLQMRAGRLLTEQDGATAPHVTVVNEAFARRFFPNENPIGHRLLLKPDAKTIVGIVGDTRQFGLEQDALPEIYTSYLQDSNRAMRLVTRVVPDQNHAAGLASLAAALRKQVLALEPDEPVNPVITMDARLAESVASRRFQTLLLGVFAAIALLLATVGIYGVIAYSVSRRTHEIGVRMALGARASNVLWLIVRQGLAPAFIGVAIGLAAAYGLTRLMASLLFEVQPTDAATFAVVALLLLGIALPAAYLPARRATKVDPLIAFRHE